MGKSRSPEEKAWERGNFLPFRDTNPADCFLLSVLRSAFPVLQINTSLLDGYLPNGPSTCGNGRWDRSLIRSFVEKDPRIVNPVIVEVSLRGTLIGVTNHDDVTGWVRSENSENRVCIIAADDSSSFAGVRFGDVKSDGDLVFKLPQDDPDCGTSLKDFTVYCIRFESLNAKLKNPLIRYSSRKEDIRSRYIHGRDQDGEGEYEVESILSHRKIDETVEYFVHWTGYSYRANTWLPMDQLSCQVKIDQYLKSVERDVKQNEFRN